MRKNELHALPVAPGTRRRGLAGVLAGKVPEGVAQVSGALLIAIGDFQVVRQGPVPYPSDANV